VKEREKVQSCGVSKVVDMAEGEGEQKKKQKTKKMI